MIVAIERSRFIYLYKYNVIGVDANHIIDLSIDNILKLSIDNKNKVVESFNKILPVFEQDHEVILLEIDKSQIKIESQIKIYFNAVLSIYPLTDIGNQLLQGKINDSFIIRKPVFEEIIREVKLIRSIELRNLAASKILDIFSLNIDNQKINLVEKSLMKIISNTNDNNNFDSFLDYLISYNKTPNNVPDGNIEFFCKIGIIVLNFKKIDESNFYKGPFYKSCLANRISVDDKSIFNSYYKFIESNDIELNQSTEKLKNNIDFDNSEIDIFKVAFFFLAYKTFLNKNDKNLDLLKLEIEKLIFDDENTASFVLVMLGYAFSFELLYESLHNLNKAPLIRIDASNSLDEKLIYLENNKKDKFTKKYEERKDDIELKDNEKSIVSEVISEPIVVFESNINKENKDFSDLTLFNEDLITSNKKDHDIDNEITKSVPELLEWLKNHKTRSKNAPTEWKKFIENHLKYGSHSLVDIYKKVKSEKLESKLTKNMLADLESFFAK